MTEPLPAPHAPEPDDDDDVVRPDPAPAKSPRALGGAGADSHLRPLQRHGSLYRLRDDGEHDHRLALAGPVLLSSRPRGWRRVVRRLLGRDPHRPLPETDAD